MNRRALVIGLTVLAVALGTSWFSRQTTRTEGGEESTAAHSPDYFVANFTATAMGPSGSPEHRLEAAHMEHFPDDRTVELTRPRYTLFRPDGAPWEVYADKGLLDDEGKLVHLQGNVRIVRPGPDSVEMLTETVRLYPDKKYAETDASLRISGPGTVINAVGMQAYVEDQRVLLLSEVRGTHER